MPAHLMTPSPIVYLTIAADTTDYDVRAAVVTATGGNPATTRYDVVLTINAGVVVYGTSANGSLHLSASGWAAGTTLKIFNNGTICGRGGDGGNGGHAVTNVGLTNGSIGRNAVYFNNANVSVVIDNVNGYIFGGGGGGGGASGGSSSDGAGGGGGRGRLGGAAGVNNGVGTAPTAGTYSAPGSGGLNASRDGGDGGDWGQSGKDGTFGLGTQGNGGAAGYAINRGTTPLSWTGGNNSTHVKGIVS